MDPVATLRVIIDPDAEREAKSQARKDLNEWLDKGGFKPAVKAWSQRVFGVPATFTVEKVGTRLLHGTWSYGMASWRGKCPPARVIEVVS